MTTKDNYAKGKDFSSHADSHDPIVKPLDFDILRLGVGNWTDPRAARNGDLRASLVNQAIRGAYWYYRSGVNWKIQCDLFLAAADSFYHFLAWDYEKKGNLLDGNTARYCQLSMEYLKARSGGRHVLLYSNTSGFNETLWPYGRWYAQEELWIAQWPYKIWYDRPGKIAPTLPKEVTSWRFWQYGADTFGTYGYKQGPEYGLGKDSVDLNHFNGSVAELRAWAGVNELPPDPPPADDKEAIIEVHNESIAYHQEKIAELA